MASLTDQLPGPGSGRRPVDAPRPQPSILSGIAEGVGNVLKITENIRAADAETALDETAGGFQRLIGEYNASGTPQPGLNPAAGDERETPTVPGDVVAGGAEILRFQAAQTQGRMTTLELQTRAQALTDSLYARFPEQRAEIAQYLTGLGYNDWQMRGMELDEAAENRAIATDAAVRNTFIQAAANAGIYNTNPEIMVETGRRILEVKADTEAADRAAAIAEERRKTEAADAPARAAESAMASTAAAAASLNTFVTPHLNRLQELSTTIGGNPGDQAAFEVAATSLRTLLDTFEVNQVAAMRRRKIDKETIEAFQADVKMQREAIEAMTSGTNSAYAANKRSYDFLQTRLQLDTSQSLRLYGSLTNLFGQATVNGWLGDTTISDEMIKALKAEVSGFSGLRANSVEYRDSILDTARILRGELNIEDMPEERARAQMPRLVATARGNQAAVIDGTATVQDNRNYVASLSQVITAATALQPGRNNQTDAVSSVTSIVATPDARRAMREVARSDPERGQMLILGSRNAALAALRASETQTLDPDGVFEIIYDRASGKYKYVANRAAFDSLRSRTMAQTIAMGPSYALNPRVMRIMQGFDAYRAAVPDDVVRSTRNMTGLLNHLLETSKDDSSVPTGLSRGQLAEAYVYNRMPERPNPITAPRVGTELQDLTSDINASRDKVIAELRPDASAETAGFESAAAQWRQNENNDGGITDINGATVRFGINAAFHPEVNQPGFTWEKAQEILKRDYWDALDADNLDPGLARLAFDQGGVIGVPTMKRLLGQANGDIDTLANLVENHYRAIVKRDPSKANQLRGWLTRLRNTRDIAGRLTGGE